MGTVTILAERRELRRMRHSLEGWGDVSGAPVAFYFDPCCPFSYLAAERIERRFPRVEWIPVSSAALETDQPWSDPPVARLLRVIAERRAAQLRLPLVWPDPFPPSGTEALRVAAYAASHAAGSAFALAASRLVFCGGFDLDDRAILFEAAAAAGIEIDDCLRAARDSTYDAQLDASARGLLALGVTQLPAVRVASRCFAGEESLEEAAAWARAPMQATRPA
jgi:2-hydroxychromene-2-carboxylate isomerase